MTDPQKEPFYIVSMGKFSILFFGTLGMYSVYWFYRMFCAMEVKTGRNMIPLGRALFAMFFVHELFGFVRKAEMQTENVRPWNPNLLAWIFIGAGVFQLLYDYVSFKYGLGRFLGLSVMLTVLFVHFYVIYQVQLAVNRIASDPFGRSNARINSRNVFWWVAFWTSYLFIVSLQPTDQAPKSFENGNPTEQGEPAPPPLY